MSRNFEKCLQLVKIHSAAANRGWSAQVCPQVKRRQLCESQSSAPPNEAASAYQYKVAFISPIRTIELQAIAMGIKLFGPA